MIHRRVDAGLPVERTSMAWQRTALAVIATAAVTARLSLPTTGVAALVALGAAGVLAAWVLVESIARGRRSRPRSGRLPAALAAATVAVAAAELVSLTGR